MTKLGPKNDASKAHDPWRDVRDWIEASRQETYADLDRVVGGDQGRTAEVLLVLHGVATGRLSASVAAEGTSLPIERVNQGAAVVLMLLRGLLVEGAGSTLASMAEVARDESDSNDRWLSLIQACETVLAFSCPHDELVDVIARNPLVSPASRDDVLALVTAAKNAGESPDALAKKVAAKGGNPRTSTAIATAKARALKKRRAQNRI